MEAILVMALLRKKLDHGDIQNGVIICPLVLKRCCSQPVKIAACLTPWSPDRNMHKLKEAWASETCRRTEVIKLH